jgi:hypothetical protein
MKISAWRTCLDGLSFRAKTSKVSIFRPAIESLEDRCLLSGGLPAGVTAFHLSSDTLEGRIAPGPDGSLWFTESNGHVGRIGADGSMTEYAPPIAGFLPGEIAIGADGNPWFSELAANEIGTISKNGTFTF